VKPAYAPTTRSAGPGPVLVMSGRKPSSSTGTPNSVSFDSYTRIRSLWACNATRMGEHPICPLDARMDLFANASGMLCFCYRNSPSSDGEPRVSYVNWAPLLRTDYKIRMLKPAQRILVKEPCISVPCLASRRLLNPQNKSFSSEAVVENESRRGLATKTRTS
jgi:hypothetical protein